MKRRTLHYVSAFLILGIYGGQVCPFLDSLTIAQLIVPIFVIMALLYLTQLMYLNGIAERTQVKFRSRRVFQLDLGSFMAAGTAVMLFNAFYYDFPIGSGLKVVLALSLLGFFAAIDLSLEKEWLLNREFETTGEQIEPDLIFFSHPKKLVFFSTFSMILLAGVIFLVINKDLDWMATVGNEIPIETAQRYILIEIGFVVGIFLLHMFNIIHSYSRNFRNFLNKETVVLQKAGNGNFEAFVPVSRTMNSV
ncbi:MAG: hypothetical protein HQ517_08880 [SAR324 cluster bacterium]|nr:hypothetical protein [SAR324 cluster bacterium]